MQRRRRLATAWSLMGIGALALAGGGALALPGLTHAASTLTVTTCTGDTGAAGDLYSAVQQANSDNDGDVIVFKCGSGAHTIPITKTLTINAPMTINGASSITLDGQHTTQVFSVTGTGASGTFTLENTAIANGSVNSVVSPAALYLYGGAMYLNAGTVAITHDTFTGNQATNSGNLSTVTGEAGGAIYDNKAMLTITNSTFTDNAVADTTNCNGAEGGAVFVENASLSISGSTFTNNTASASGVSYYCWVAGAGVSDEGGSGALSVTTSIFSGNVITESGTGTKYVQAGAAGIYIGNPTGPFTGDTFEKNSVAITGVAPSVYGVGAENNGGDVENSTFAGNTATVTAMSGDGYIEGIGFDGYGTGSLLGDTIEKNSVTISSANPEISGVGAQIDAGDIENSTFAGNTATITATSGVGDIYGVGLYGYGKGVLTGDTFSGNTATEAGSAKGAYANLYGGGMYLDGSSDTVTQDTFSDNTLTGASGDIAEGAGVYFDTPRTVSASTFSGNKASAGDAEGAGAYVNSVGTMSISASTFTQNMTDSGASGVYGGGSALENYGSTLTLIANTLAGNTATGTGSKGGAVLTVGLAGNAASTAIGGSLFANNSGGDCALGASGTQTDLGYNLESGTACGFTNAGGVKGDKQNVTDPKLATTLANNGGPTKTLALLAGSPAIDAIPDATSVTSGTTTFKLCPATDQRGVARPQGSGCDIGAYEYQKSSSTNGLSGNGAPNNPTTAQAPSASSASGTSSSPNAPARPNLPAKPKAPHQPVVVTATPSSPQGGFPLSFAVLLAILGFALLGSGALVLGRTRKVDAR